MLGVDKSDQLIAYYRPKIRVCRWWMAILFHCLDIVRINSYIYAKKSPGGNDKLKHKDFMLHWIGSFFGRADIEKFGATRQAETEIKRKRDAKKSHRVRVSAKLPMLPRERLYGKIEDHKMMSNASTSEVVRQQFCRYCCYLAALDRKDGKKGNEVHKIKSVQKICSFCRYHVCQEHFKVFHLRE